MLAATRLIVAAVAYCALLGGSDAIAGDPAKAAAAVDRMIDERLRSAGVPSSPIADEAESLRRATLDIIGRIPSREETIAHLADQDPDKRRRLIDDLLSRPAYGEFLATIWREQIAPTDTSSAKQSKDSFSPWLAEQFNRDRGWDAIVTDLLTAEGKIRDNPAGRRSSWPTARASSRRPICWPMPPPGCSGACNCGARSATIIRLPPGSRPTSGRTAAFFSASAEGLPGGQEPDRLDVHRSAAGRADQPEVRRVSAACPRWPVRRLSFPTRAASWPSRRVRARFLGGDGARLARTTGPSAPVLPHWATGREQPVLCRQCRQSDCGRTSSAADWCNPLDEFHDGESAVASRGAGAALRRVGRGGLRSQASDPRDLQHASAYQRTSRPVRGQRAGRRAVQPHGREADAAGDALRLAQHGPLSRRRAKGRQAAKSSFCPSAAAARHLAR